MLNLSRLSTIKLFITRNSFRKEIILVVCLKLVAIFLLAEFFLSLPVAEQLTKPALAEHFVVKKSPIISAQAGKVDYTKFRKEIPLPENEKYLA